jgi:hypothetical protein
MLLKNIPLHIQGLNYREGVYELKDHVGQEALNSNLLLKLRPIKRIIPTCFPNHLLESVLVRTSFPYVH